MGQRMCSLAGCERPHLARGYCSKHYWQLVPRNQPHHRPYERTCEACGRAYTTTRNKKLARVCNSPHCRWFISPQTIKSSLLDWRQCIGCNRWLGRPGRPWCSDACRPRKQKRDHPRFHAGWCHLCGRSFIDVWNNRPALFCSPRCSRRHHRDLRRARKREAFVAPVWRERIYERDGWRCQLCGKKVKRNAEVPHQLAPVLDHIIPLARGGTHEPANVQCAHYRCNYMKCCGGIDQLLLFG
jgi:hypothetical protein